MIGALLTLALAAASQTPPPAPLPAAEIEGRWHNLTNSVEVKIAPCGKLLCGWAIRASADAEAAAKGGGTPELVGVMLLKNLAPAGKNRWTGSLFVPDRSITVWSSVTLVNFETIAMRGCLVPNFLCKTQTWKRAS